MIDPRNVTAILLAAGRASRFGADKLVQPLSGRPVVEHAATTLASIGFGRLLVLRRAGAAFDLPGFEDVIVPEAAPQSLSLRLGIAAAKGAEAALVALADMPLVPAVHFAALLAAHDSGITATARDGLAMVPAVFAAERFADFTALDGDRGAQRLLADARLVEARPEWLADIDTPGDLARLNGGSG